jgi:hypothetical protein
MHFHKPRPPPVCLIVTGRERERDIPLVHRFHIFGAAACVQLRATWEAPLLYKSRSFPLSNSLLHLHHQRRVEHLLSFSHAPAHCVLFTFPFTLFQLALLPKPFIHCFADLLIQINFHSFNSIQRLPQSSQGPLVSSCSYSLDGELQLRQQFTAFTTHRKTPYLPYSWRYSALPYPNNNLQILKIDLQL